MGSKSKDEKGRIKLLAILIWENQPWRLVPHLAGATAAAAATATYAVITTSFWTFADSLSLWRLGLISIVAIGAMVMWLLLYNHLWEKPRKRSDREKVILYNVSTLATLFIGVACMYAILFSVTMIAAFAVIDNNYLSSRLGHPSDFSNYAAIVWLASSVGIVAGALGSSFESEEAVRKATYSKRELKRQSISRK